MPIVVENLTYSYMTGGPLSNSALNDVSLTIQEGEFLGIIGHTGSGKSTLVQHLNGLLQPEKGKVSVDGLDMADKKQRLQGRRLVGLVFQYPEYQLFEETVAKDVAFGPRNLGLDEDEIALRVCDALLTVGLPPERFAQKIPFELSGGEKRRAALAGILAMRPKYLVLDEPMAGLDPSGRHEILDMLDALRVKTGCAIVMVSHSMDDMARCAQRIAVLNKGCIARVGTPQEIFGQSEMLTSVGLDVPQIAALAQALRARGVDVPHDVYDLESMLHFLRERGRQNV